MLPETLHKLGTTVEGTRCLFEGCIEGDEFDEVVAFVGLPKGWFAYHVTLEECGEPPSERVAMLREMPTVMRRTLLGGWERAPWRESLEQARASSGEDYNGTPQTVLTRVRPATDGDK